MKKVAQLISVLFHPLLLPLYAVWLLLNSGGYLSYAIPDKFRQYLYVIIFFSTFLMPSLLTWLLVQRGRIKSIELEERRERHLPYLLTLCCTVITAYLLYRLPLPRLIAFTLMGSSVAILTAFLINLRWKISVHMIGIGGLLGLFFGFGIYYNIDTFSILLVIAALAGLIAAARLARESHSPAQVYAGFLVGYAVELGFMACISGSLPV